ncbi:MAG: diguanylate cyclase [Pseudomonadota bacterium]
MARQPAQPASARIQRRCLDLMFGQTRSAYLYNVFCAALLATSFWGNVERAWLLAWLGLSAVLVVAREIQATRYARRAGQPIDVTAWTRWLDLSLFLNGCLWGVGCSALALLATPYQLPLIVLIVGGLQTGSILSSSYRLRAFALFSLPLLSLTLLAFVVLGATGQPSLFATAAILAVWSLFILMCASRFGHHYRRSLEYALDNADLVETLQTKNAENETLNQTLRSRIGELHLAQRDLLTEKQRADGLVVRLRKLSTTDGLTGVGNRRYFDERLAQEWRRATRSATPLSLILVDVDHFKAFNDHYGHRAGDGCLIDIAQALAGAAQRASDAVARYGGEEFGLILADTSLEAATGRARHALKAIRALAIEHAASPCASIVTASLGVATIVPDATRAHTALVELADQALYDAKHRGRDRVAARSSDSDPSTALLRGA